MKRKRIPAIFWIKLTLGLFFIALLSSCSQREVETFAFNVYEINGEGELSKVEELKLLEEPGVEPELEGLLLENDGRFTGPRYSLEEERVFPGDAFHVVYSSSRPVRLELFFEQDREQMVTLSKTGGEIRERLIPLYSEEGTAFRFSSTEQKDPGFTLHEAAVSSLEASEEGAGAFRFIRYPAEEESEPKFHQYGLTLSYRFEHDGETAREMGHDEPLTVDIGLGDGDKRAQGYSLYAREGEHSVFFYSKDLGFSPRSLKTGSIPEGFQIVGVSYQPYTLYAERLLDPIPADPGVVLDYNQEAWRRGGWELFYWNIFPKILIFDFRDYQVQANFLKRLAFFVEKKGTTGKLLNNEDLASLHGWNAHDYRAQDLARFFDVAEKEDFSLKEEEYLLRDILLNQDIIKKEGQDFTAGEGGILSLSRESSERLRYLFMIHEGYHGLFFASQEYREEVERIWRDLNEDEREFWRVFLDWRNYNTEDEYLLINEFQAYLMQQHTSYVETYFKEYTIPQLLRRYPEYSEYAEYFLENYPDHFIDSAIEVEEAAWRNSGIRSGDLLCLRETEEKVARIAQ